MADDVFALHEVVGLCKLGRISDRKGHSKETRVEGMSY
jgi:hypothetical protein